MENGWRGCFHGSVIPALLLRDYSPFDVKNNDVYVIAEDSCSWRPTPASTFSFGPIFIAVFLGIAIFLKTKTNIQADTGGVSNCF